MGLKQQLDNVREAVKEAQNLVIKRLLYLRRSRVDEDRLIQRLRGAITDIVYDSFTDLENDGRPNVDDIGDAVTNIGNELDELDEFDEFDGGSDLSEAEDIADESDESDASRSFTK